MHVLLFLLSSLSVNENYLEASVACISLLQSFLAVYKSFHVKIVYHDFIIMIRRRRTTTTTKKKKKKKKINEEEILYYQNVCTEQSVFAL